MTPFVRLVGASIFACAFVIAGDRTASSDDLPAAIAPDQVAAAAPSYDPVALAEGYFEESERFDAFLTYEAKRGPAGVLFTIARRWRAGLADLLFNIREPASYDKWALLMHLNHGGSDDLFLYAGYATELRVRRLAASQIERQAIFELLALGDYRPTVRDEQSYEAAADETLGSVLCHVVVARTPQPYLGFDRLELVFAADQKLLLEQRFFRGSKEVRRLTTTLADYKDIGGRRLPMRWLAHRWADGGETEIVLKNVVETADLPDRLFSHQNLKERHFPEF
jgi:outer membrane lipoprotein-sorting protein